MEKYLGVYINAGFANSDEIKIEKVMLMNILKVLDGDDSLIRYISAIVKSAEMNIKR